MKKVGLTILILAVAVLVIVGIEKATPPRSGNVAIPEVEEPSPEPAARKPNIELIHNNLRRFERVNVRAEPVVSGAPVPRARGSRHAPPVTQRRTPAQ